MDYELRVKRDHLLCKCSGHKLRKEPWPVHNFPGQEPHIAYWAFMCERLECYYKEPTTEEGRKMMQEDQARVSNIMNGDREKLGLPPIKFFD